MNKDIRNITSVNNNYIITFTDIFNYNDFIDLFMEKIRYYCYFTIEDLLKFLNMEANFKNSSKYGWGANDLVNSNIKLGQTEINMFLPPPRPVDEIILNYNHIYIRYNKYNNEKRYS